MRFEKCNRASRGKRSRFVSASNAPPARVPNNQSQSIGAHRTKEFRRADADPRQDLGQVDLRHNEIAPDARILPRNHDSHISAAAFGRSDQKRSTKLRLFIADLPLCVLSFAFAKQ